MAINFTGDVLQGSNSLQVGITSVGAGTVDAGSLLEFPIGPPFSSADLEFVLGENAGSQGTMNITGSGSTLLMETGNWTPPTLNAIVDIGQAGTGVMNVSAGGSAIFGGLFSGTTASVNIGKTAGSVGTINLNSGFFSVQGQTSYIGIASDGGSGTVNLEGNSFLSVEGDADDGLLAHLAVGRSGTGTGNLNLSVGSKAAIFTDDEGMALLDIGRDGSTGSITLDGNSNIQLLSEQEVYSTMGRNGGAATLLLTDNSNVQLGSSHPSGTAPNPAASSGATFDWGVDNGTAVIDVDDSQLHISSTVGDTGGTLGRNQNGLAATNLTEATMTLTNGSFLSISTNLHDAYLNIARDVMTKATVNIADSTIQMTSTVPSGVPSGDATLTIGRDGGEGTVNLDNATVRVTSEDGEAAVFMGRSPTFSGGSATVIMENGTDFELTGDFAVMEVGSEAGVSADLQVLSGSTLTVTGTGVGTVAEPYVGQFGIGSSDNVVSATVLIDGTGSEIEVSHGMEIGRTVGNGGMGNGFLEIMNGGTLSSGDVFVGAGGHVIAGDATINLDFSAPQGGLLDFDCGALSLLASGPLTVNGNLAVGYDNDITFGVAADGSSAGKLIHNGNVLSLDGNGGPASSIFIEPQGGYQFGQGDSYVLVESNASTADPFLPLDPTKVSVNGQDADFGFMLTELQAALQTLTFTALNNGNGTGVSTIDFGATSAIGASFTLDTGALASTGSGGDLGSVLAFNADALAGTAVADTFVVIGSTGVTLEGRNGSDDLTGGSGADDIFGGDGNDTINGGLGFDTIVAGRGVDTLSGGGGNDDIELNGGSDFAFGQGGNDLIRGGGGIDTISGGSGADEIYGDAGNDVIDGDSAGDTVFGGAGNDTIFGGNGSDTLEGEAGDDTINGEGFTDTIRGGDGSDTLSGGGGVDDLFGNDDGDFLFGNNGGDFLDGGAGDDELNGGASNDELHGGIGDDLILGSTGDDKLYGDGGADTFQFRANHGVDRIFDFEDGTDLIGFNINSVNDISDLTLTNVFAGVDIDYGTGTIRVLGFDDADFSSDDFVFV